MRLQPSTSILALLPLAICDPSSENVNSNVMSAFDNRAAQGNPFLAERTSALLNAPSGFQVASFEAFMPLPEGDNKFSRAIFDILLNPPTPDNTWRATCWVLTNETLCDPDLWRSCDQVAGDGNENEKLWFKLGKDLSSLDIKRRWTVQGMTMTATASESATWNESVNPAEGNVTLSNLGKWYKRPNGWVLPFKTLVG